MRDGERERAGEGEKMSESGREKILCMRKRRPVLFANHEFDVSYLNIKDYCK